MKLCVVIAATTLTFSSAAQCNLSKLLPLQSDPRSKKCSSDADYSFVPPTKPSPAVMDKMCKSDACVAVLKTVSGLGLGDCTVFGFRLQVDLIDAVTAYCKSKSASPLSASYLPGRVKDVVKYDDPVSVDVSVSVNTGSEAETGDTGFLLEAKTGDTGFSPIPREGGETVDIVIL
jgi:hypothetical protein